MVSSTANLVYEFSQELPKELRLRILGNKEILGTSQIWVETYPSAHSLFQKLNSVNSSQKTRKSRYQTFLGLSSFTRFLYFVPNILSRIVSENKYWVLNRPSLFQTLITWHFVYHQSIFPIFYGKYKAAQLC